MVDRQDSFGGAGHVADASTRGGSRPDITPLTRDEDGTKVEITLAHCSLENAEYPVMVGTFAGEYLSGAERFLDQQLNGQLTSSWEVGRYPSELGTSLFIAPSRAMETATQPPGAYIIGLGSTMRLGRNELAFAVQQALVDRCLRLYRDPPDDGGQPGEPIFVGVSSILLGVRNDDGLRVEDAVVGIVEGVQQANRLLVRYEQSRNRVERPLRNSEPERPVRITALEFVERYGDRADLAAVALRSLSTAVQLTDDYKDLRALTVDHSKAGGFPAGAALFESPARWRRILLTGAPGDEAAPSAGPSRRLDLDVAVLGGDARADRVRHHLDRVMVDALVERLSTSTGDEDTAGTLYDQLVPHELRGPFLSTSSIHIIVDKTTANYPWELLTVPQRSGARKALASGGAVLRQFAESEERRLNPLRAVAGKALVIAAGKVPGHTELPYVYKEAAAVRELLRPIVKVASVDDQQHELDLANVQNALFAGPQILHLATHGMYHADRPEETGAVLSELGMLTVDTVGQLTSAPDVVFLNCCSLGKVGMSRVAAGLAREFMAIGAGAVVAAGWQINDAAAEAFATAFYEELINGRPFGEAVTTARNECAKRGGRQTWAAYQCYGDPAFVLSNRKSSLSRALSEPVSVTDLFARLETLETRASDLGRPGKGGVIERREQLSEEWRKLADWVDGTAGVRKLARVQRLLGRAARQLGNFQEASDRYRQLIDLDPGGGRVGLRFDDAAPVDLQQAANCLARAAQREAREAREQNDPPKLARAREDFDRAGRLALAALAVIPNKESHGIFGSALKKLASVTDSGREPLVRGALQAYRDGQRAAGGEAWGTQNALQLALIVGGDDEVQARAALATARPPAADAGRLDSGVAPTVARRVDQRWVAPEDFWTRAGRGDLLLTELIAARKPADCARLGTGMVEAYELAFEGRSTYSERSSVLDHLQDLADLLAGDDPRRAELVRGLAGLQRWEKEHVETEAGSGTRTDTGTETRRQAAVIDVPGPGSRDRQGAVTLTALPAGCGDCLILDYRDRGRRGPQDADRRWSRLGLRGRARQASPPPGR